MRACVLTYILACSIRHPGAAAAATCPTCWLGSEDGDTRSVVVLADWRQQTNRLATVFFFCFCLCNNTKVMKSTFLLHTSCPSRRDFLSILAEWRSRGRGPSCCSSSPSPPPSDSTAALHLLSVVFITPRPPSLCLRCSSTATSCQHDDLSPAPAGEEHRAQLFRGGDQGMAGDEVSSDGVIPLVDSPIGREGKPFNWWATRAGVAAGTWKVLVTNLRGGKHSMDYVENIDLNV